MQVAQLRRTVFHSFEGTGIHRHCVVGVIAYAGTEGGGNGEVFPAEAGIEAQKHICRRRMIAVAVFHCDGSVVVQVGIGSFNRAALSVIELLIDEE